MSRVSLPPLFPMKKVATRGRKHIMGAGEYVENEACMKMQVSLKKWTRQKLNNQFCPSSPRKKKFSHYELVNSWSELGKRKHTPHHHKKKLSLLFTKKKNSLLLSRKQEQLRKKKSIIWRVRYTPGLATFYSHLKTNFRRGKKEREGVTHTCNIRSCL